MISAMAAVSDITDEDRQVLRVEMRAHCDAGERFFAEHASAIATCAAAMADRFFAGATLLVFGSGAAVTDAQHNAVEYVHPVLPGCRALPALSLSNDVAILAGGTVTDTYAHQIRLLGRTGDIALAFASYPPAPAIVAGLEAATKCGMEVIVLSTGGGVPDIGNHHFHVAGHDALLAQELHLATYHMLWELVHIILNHRGIAAEAP